MLEQRSRPFRVDLGRATQIDDPGPPPHGPAMIIVHNLFQGLTAPALHLRDDEENQIGGHHVLAEERRLKHGPQDANRAVVFGNGIEKEK